MKLVPPSGASPAGNGQGIAARGSVTGIGAGTTGSTPFAGGGGTLGSALAADHPARGGWVSGTVAASLADGSMRISAGDALLTIRTGGTALPQGSTLELTVSGQEVRLRPLTPGNAAASGQAVTAALPGAGDPATGTPRLALALAGMAPVTPSPAAAQAQATQALSAVFPQAGSPAFSIIAALFPLVLRDGSLRRLAAAQNSRFGRSDSRLGGIATAALDMAAARPGDDPAYLRWTLPFFHEGTLKQSHWGREPAETAEQPQRSHVFLEISFPFSGLLRINALHDISRIVVHVQSERALAHEILTDLAAILHELAGSLGLEAEFHHGIGIAEAAASDRQSGPKD